MTSSRKWWSAIHSASCCWKCINVQLVFFFIKSKIKTGKQATTDTYNRNKRFTKLSCYSDKEFARQIGHLDSYIWEGTWTSQNPWKNWKELGYHIRKRPTSLHCSGSKEEITCPLSGKSSPSIPHPLWVCFPGFILTDFTYIQRDAAFIQF